MGNTDPTYLISPNDAMTPFLHIEEKSQAQDENPTETVLRPIEDEHFDAPKPVSHLDITEPRQREGLGSTLNQSGTSASNDLKYISSSSGSVIRNDEHTIGWAATDPIMDGFREYQPKVTDNIEPLPAYSGDTTMTYEPEAPTPRLLVHEWTTTSPTYVFVDEHNRRKQLKGEAL